MGSARCLRLKLVERWRHRAEPPWLLIKGCSRMNSKFELNNITYIVDSKLATTQEYEHLNNLYGISKEEKKEINNLLLRQKKFLVKIK